MLKVGDIVRIRNLKPGLYNGYRFNEIMAAQAGKICVITGGRLSVFFLEDSGWAWTEPMLEPVDNKDLEVFGIVNGFLIPVEYKAEVSSWIPKDPKKSTFEHIHPHYIHVMKHIDKHLNIDIFGVGSRGDLVELVNFDGRYYLSAKYLPMCGIIERWCLSEV